MEHLSKIELVGRVGAVHEQTIGNERLVRFSVGVNTVYRGGAGATVQTTWFNCVYWGNCDIECEYFDYEDDPSVELCGRKWEPHKGEFKPDTGVDWLAGKFTEGELWINTCDGVMVLIRPDGQVLMSTI